MSKYDDDLVAGFKLVSRILSTGDDQVTSWWTHDPHTSRFAAPLHNLDGRENIRKHHWDEPKTLFTHRTIWANFVRKTLGLVSPIETKHEIKDRASKWVITSVDRAALEKLLAAIQQRLRPLALEKIADLEKDPLYDPTQVPRLSSLTNTEPCDWQETFADVMAMPWTEDGVFSVCEIPPALRSKILSLVGGE